jgi:hypothetical protein
MSPELKMRATQCVQRECTWPSAAFAESRLVHSHPLRAPTLSIRTRHRLATEVTVTAIEHITAAHPVIRCRVETAHHTKAQSAEDGAVGMAVRPVTRYKVEIAHHTGDQLVLAQATITVERAEQLGCRSPAWPE